MYHSLNRALVAMMVLAPATAAASPLFELVGDPSGEGGLTARVNARGSAAAYFNPALLADAAPGLDLGQFFVAQELGVEVDARSSSALCAGGACDVPSVSDRGPESFRHESTGESIGNPTLPTDWLQHGHGMLGPRPRQGQGTGRQEREYQTIGVVLSPLFHHRLVLGLFAMIPLGEFTTAKAFYNDEREQYFSNSLHPELYGDRLTATSLAFGGAFRVRDDLSVGMTFTLSLANHASAPVYVSNLNDLQTVLLDSDIAVETAVAPHWGVAWKPRAGALVTATLHTPQAFRIDTGFDYTLATGSQQSTELHFTHSFVPLTIAAGASWTFGGAGGTWAASAVATWAEWSHYRDRHDQNPGGEYAWSDTLSAAAGVRYHAGSIHAWCDALFQPTPVPPQTGRSNYVDSDRLGVTLGLEDRRVLWGNRVRAGAELLGHWVIEQHVDKFVTDGHDPQYVVDEVPDDAVDVLGEPVTPRSGVQTNNPGFPGFTFGGVILGAGVHVAVEY